MKIAAVLLFAVLSNPGDVYRSAWADYKSLPLDQQQYTVYLSLHDVEEKLQGNLEAVTKVVVCSLSHKTHLPSQLPVKLNGLPLLRLDLYALGWQDTYGQVIYDNYPYYLGVQYKLKPPGYPLVVSALWFITNITDADKTGKAQNLLLYGSTPPKNAAELLKFWKVDQTRQNIWGHIEGTSGVANRTSRTLQSYPIAQRSGYAWITFDFIKFNAKTDPLESLSPIDVGDVKRYDASEAIISILKHSNGKSGALQAYALFDSKGELQDKAPTNIVTDHKSTRGPEIINLVSCIPCHSQGIIPPTTNEYRTYLESGAVVHAKKKQDREVVETFLENNINGEVKQHQDAYAAGVDMCSGLTPEKFAQGFFDFVKYYDADVSLSQGARELEVSEIELKHAIAWNAVEKVVPVVEARLAQFAHGVEMPRDRWEQVFYCLPEILAKWNLSKMEE